MSIRGAFAAPQEIEFLGRKAKLHPMSIYELGLCESSYAAFCTRQALEATIGMPVSERDFALEKAAERVADLDIDVSPVYEWITGSYEGLTRVLAFCIELEDGKNPTLRETARWYELSGKQDEGSPTYRWLIDSRLRPDPTELAPSEEPESEEATDQAEAENKEPSTAQ